MRASDTTAKRQMPLPSISSGDVDAALGLVEAAPAAGARVLARRDPRRAGHAADRRVALGDQRMLGQVVPLGIGLEVDDRPARQRIDLDAARRRPRTAGSSARGAFWKRLRPVNQASKPASARCSGSVLRIWQQRSGLVIHSARCGSLRREPRRVGRDGADIGQAEPVGERASGTRASRRTAGRCRGR